MKLCSTLKHITTEPLLFSAQGGLQSQSAQIDRRIGLSEDAAHGDEAVYLSLKTHHLHRDARFG